MVNKSSQTRVVMCELRNNSWRTGWQIVVDKWKLYLFWPTFLPTFLSWHTHTQEAITFPLRAIATRCAHETPCCYFFTLLPL